MHRLKRYSIIDLGESLKRGGDIRRGKYERGLSGMQLEVLGNHGRAGVALPTVQLARDLEVGLADGGQAQLVGDAALGHLDEEPLGELDQPGAFGRAPDAAAAEQLRGDVDTQVDGRVRCDPLAELGCGLLDDPLGERSDHGRALGDGDELRRGDELAAALPDDAALLAAPVRKLQAKLTRLIYDAKHANALDLGTRAFQALMRSLADDGATAWHLQCPYAPTVALAPDHFRAMIRLELGLGPTPNGDPRRLHAIMNSRHGNQGGSRTRIHDDIT